MELGIISNKSFSNNQLYYFLLKVKKKNVKTIYIYKLLSKNFILFLFFII